MIKCCSKIFDKMTSCIKRKKYIKIKNFEQEKNTTNINNREVIIYQKSSTNNYIPQGDYTKLENYDLFEEFMKCPLVKIYIEEIFRPNKEIKNFQIEKVKGIFNQIKDVLYKLFSRLNLILNIPSEDYYLNSNSFKIYGKKPTDTDLDLYTPLFFMEWWIYNKSFIKESQLKQITLVHSIKYYDEDKNCEKRAGCPEYDITKSIILSTKEKNFAYIRIVLHHEFFHFIDYTDDHDFTDDGWEELNQKGFKYGDGGSSERNWIKLEKNVRGFINHYSTSALEEDRAEIYQYLLSCPDEALNNKDIIVRKKAKRIQNFLNQKDMKGMGDAKNNFWANLIDYRSKFVYKEKVFQGNICK